jgi:hypothetical protein
MTVRKGLFASIVVSLFWLTLPYAHAENMEIMESNVDAYPVGAVIPEDKKLAQRLPPDGRVKAMLYDKKTIVFESPIKTHNPAPRGPVGGTRRIYRPDQTDK